MTTVAASIPVLRWAAQRARLHDDDLVARFPKWPLWLRGEARPTLRQLEGFARLTHTAFGYFFLPQPPVLALPVPDFRTLRDEMLAEPSSELLDTLYLCQQRQDWYREHARMQGLPVLSFVGSASVQDSPHVVARLLRETLGLSAEARRQLPTWTDALRQLIAKAEDAGVLVMVSSVVGSNSHRKLDVGEFRGLALVDELAPLVFLNGADSKAAQMFTLAHELAHVWLGATGVSDTQAGRVPEQQTERWCNQVAAELLVPMEELRTIHQRNAPIADEIQRLARQFKVSTLVALRRLFDAGYINQDALWQHYSEEVERLRALKDRRSSGGDF
ncbi:MAG TPA: ImmA/IrrE family metallo-endopeptidase, partial [Burkholderiaceae bacterium]|nr:ImmA/IrrE family metallo-endopeptidase [Burkholderiaceae bacterium]